MEVSQPLDHITHAVIGGGKTIDFGISNSAEFFDILSRTLYTDQMLAVVREVLCNAWDAHIVAGIEHRPIEIKLDSEYLIVRDFGTGIPDDKIGPIYGVYGASTKKNDGAQTGGFGLGCKAPFAYTDHFEVTSMCNGIRTIYNMSKSSAQVKGKPGIVPLARLPTTETGLQVKIPIQAKDWQRFEELIRRIVRNGEMRATLNTKELAVLPFSQCQHGYYMTTKALMGERSTDLILLRYGNVIYPVQDSLEFDGLWGKVKEVLERFNLKTFINPLMYKLVLQAPPDTIAVTPSREQLSLQEHTVKTLKRLFNAFLEHTRELDNQILVEVRAHTDTVIRDKDYGLLFSKDWCVKEHGLSQTNPDITDLQGMARFQLTKPYPKSVNFRLGDLSYRVQKSADAKIVDKHLADTFLEGCAAVKSTVTDWNQRYRHDNKTDWLHRRVIGKVVTKLLKANLDPNTLYLIDANDPLAEYNRRVVLAKDSSCRHHLTNLPYLRKAVVVTTAITTVGERLQAYCRLHPSAPRDGLLCYHVKSRKAGSAEEAVAFFTNLGYEVVDLTKRYDFDPKPIAPALRAKREPYSGLPALTNIVTPTGAGIDIQRWRRDDATRIAKPEFVLIVPMRAIDSGSLDGHTRASTRAIIELYGDRVGVADGQTQYKRAIKHGARDFKEFLEEQLQLELLTSPTVAEYLAYAYFRVTNTTSQYESNMQALDLIYKTPELRAEFGLKNNLTADEVALIKIFQHSKGLSHNCIQALKDYAESIPLAPENNAALVAVTGNNLVNMLDFHYVKSGLRDNKRQAYLDILIKALKG